MIPRRRCAGCEAEKRSPTVITDDACQCEECGGGPFSGSYMHTCLGRTLCSECNATARAASRIHGVLRDLVAALERCAPDVAAALIFREIHTGRLPPCSYAEEFVAAKALLDELDRGVHSVD